MICYLRLHTEMQSSGGTGKGERGATKIVFLGKRPVRVAAARKRGKRLVLETNKTAWKWLIRVYDTVEYVPPSTYFVSVKIIDSFLFMFFQCECLKLTHKRQRWREPARWLPAPSCYHLTCCCPRYCNWGRRKGEEYDLLCNKSSGSWTSY